MTQVGKPFAEFDFDNFSNRSASSPAFLQTAF
jgi:hypothetical protein